MTDSMLRLAKKAIASVGNGMNVLGAMKDAAAIDLGRFLGNDPMHMQAPKPWYDDLEAIAVTMAEALRGQYDGWETVTPFDVVIEDFGAGPGRRVFKLTNSARPAAPAAVLHIVRDAPGDSFEDPIFFDRQRAAQHVFAKAGISPPRIAEDPGKEWFVDGWAGNRLPESAGGCFCPSSGCRTLQDGNELFRQPSVVGNPQRAQGQR